MTTFPPIDLDKLSDDAKLIGGLTFGMSIKKTTTYQLRESRPSDRNQAALDELIAAGYVSVEPYNDFGGRVYKSLADFHAAWVWVNTERARLEKGGDLCFEMTTKLTPDEALKLMTPWGQGVTIKETTALTPAKANPFPPDSKEHGEWNKGYRAGYRDKRHYPKTKKGGSGT